MEDLKALICKLCLTIIHDEDYKNVENDTQDILGVFSIKPDVDGEDKSLICNLCWTKLVAAKTFKLVCLYTDNIINSSADATTTLPFDLSEVYMKATPSEHISDDINICRLCMQPIKHMSGFKTINEEHADLIKKFVPEMNIFIVKEPVMCKFCLDSLAEHCNFLKNVEQNIGIISNGQVRDAPSPAPSLGISMKIENVDGLSDVPELIKTEFLDIKCEGINNESELNGQQISSEEATGIEYETRGCNYMSNRTSSPNEQKATSSTYKCEKCDYRSKRKGYFTKHLLIHKDPSQERHEAEAALEIMATKNFTVQYLKDYFHSLSYEQKITVGNAGRPKPDLDLSQTTKGKSRDFTRTFKNEIYDKRDWICGCSTTNSLFCFPCLLFGRGISDPSWTRDGVKDLAHLVQKIKKHENTQAHINAQLELKLLGKVGIRQQLDSAYRLSIEQQNKEIRKNRDVLSKIIDRVKYCRTCELAPRGHDASECSSNLGIFNGLNFSPELDTPLTNQFENDNVFKGTSEIIQNDLLDCMLVVAQERIKKEIAEAEYVAVIADETTDTADHYQMAVIFRYILPDGTPVERFWCFIKPPTYDAVSVSECMKSVLTEVIDKPGKLISQSYDGASGCYSLVQNLIRSDYKYAFHVHCYAHNIDSILSQAVSKYREVHVFLSNLSEISNFVSHSAQRVAILDEIFNRGGPPATIWNDKSRTISMVYEHRELLIECMEKIEATSRQTVTINQASAIIRMLHDPKFVFWLAVFHRIMLHIDILHNQLQETVTDLEQIESTLTCFEDAILKQRDNLETIDNELAECSLQAKKRRINKNSCALKIVAAKEVCDAIIAHVKVRFSFTKHLNASVLFASDRFANMEKSFPMQHLKATVEAYPFLDKVRLQTELGLIYKRPEFRNMSGAIHLLKFITDNDLQSIFSATFALLQIIVTIPMTTVEVERSSSTLERVKKFLRSSVNQESLTALAMLCVEKEFIQGLPDFNEAVIDKFAKNKNRSVDFTVKHCNTV